GRTRRLEHLLQRERADSLYAAPRHRLLPEDAHGRALPGQLRRAPQLTSSRSHDFPSLVKVLLLNQCFYPDVVSTAQHLTDLALELSARGNEVTVVTSRRGYDNSQIRFPARETWKGI